MGRLSQIHIQMRAEDQLLLELNIGGEIVVMGEGTLQLPAEEPTPA